MVTYTVGLHYYPLLHHMLDYSSTTREVKATTIGVNKCTTGFSLVKCAGNRCILCKLLYGIYGTGLYVGECPQKTLHSLKQWASAPSGYRQQYSMTVTPGYIMCVTNKVPKVHKSVGNRAFSAIAPKAVE